ncbi:MAG TPA: alpha-L-fucosidase [Candidatus Acidoferrum sp.]|nr:alpha-L-fucosidase [Candidatus Acidoferrum sp.]
MRTAARKPLAGVLMLPAVAFVSALAQTGPDTTPDVVARAAAAAPAIAPGKFQPTWESLRTNYVVPEWFLDAKFGIFMHWGLYAVPAHGSEWYEKHMYGNPGITRWQTEHFGPPDTFGYKDFVPMFTCAKWDPDAWAALFKQAGARIVIPTAEHHDGFALWDSAVNPWNAKRLGPQRDLIGDLARAVRRQGLKFGVSNHGIEHFSFIRPTPGLATDLYNTNWADFYSVADRSPAACEKFLADWVAQNAELIDQYQPDMLWFDNGVNARLFDPLKLKVAAYYYNRAAAWDKQVSLSTKGSGAAAGPAYLAGSILDFERSSRMPKERTDFVWQVDEPVLYRFGYTENSPIASAAGSVRLLVDATSKNGALLLNISPKADGTIPDDQQKLLRQIGAWLEVNGDAIYGTRPWTRSGEGGGRGFRFTTKGDTLYAIALSWPTNGAWITAVPSAVGKVTEVELLGHAGALGFSQDAAGLKIEVPAEKPGDYAYAFRIRGLKLK